MKAILSLVYLWVAYKCVSICAREWGIGFFFLLPGPSLRLETMILNVFLSIYEFMNSMREYTKKIVFYQLNLPLEKKIPMLVILL